MSVQNRKCVTTKEWDKMSLEEKVEALGDWSVYLVEWAEMINRWQNKVDGLISGFFNDLKEFESKANGGGIPPKHPKDPHC